MELEPDTSINMKRVSISKTTGLVLADPSSPQISWGRIQLDEAHGVYKDNKRPSFGAPSHVVSGAVVSRAIVLSIESDVFRSNAALYALKIYKEWSTLLYMLTNNVVIGGKNYGWDGVEMNISLEQGALPSNSFSPIPGQVFIATGQHFERDTYFHELSHQIMWRYINMTGVEILVRTDYFLYHQVHYFTTPQEAFAEGWAEFFEFLVVDTSSWYYPMRYIDVLERERLVLGSYRMGVIGPPGLGGESVEGALAYPLWAIFKKYVHGPEVPPAKPLPPLKETLSDGDVRTVPDNAWLASAAIRQRFVELIWKPFVDLGVTNTYPGTSDYLRKMWALNSSTRYKLKSEFYAYNNTVDPSTSITVSSITMKAGGALTGNIAGGDVLVVSGAGFVDRLDATYRRPIGSPSQISGMHVAFWKGGLKVSGKNIVVKSEALMEVETPSVSIDGDWEVVVSLLVRDYDVGRVTGPAPAVKFKYVK
jgi:hypothetical protein